MSEELATLYPEGKQITIHNEELTILPFKFGKLAKVFKCIQPIAYLFGSVDKLDKITIATRIIADGGEGIYEFMSIGSDKSLQWIMELEMDEGVELLTAIIEVNADFFTQRLMPKLTQMLTATGQTS